MLPDLRLLLVSQSRSGARSNVVLTIMEFTWNDGGSPAKIDSHRYAIVERFSPDRVPGNPTANANPATFTSITD